MSVSDIIYHGGCADGFTSAWLLNEAYPEAALHPARYGQPVIVAKGSTVIMADFSFKRPDILELASYSEKVIILDHHKTAAEDLVDLPDNVEAVFDMDRSGARITYDWLVGNGVIFEPEVETLVNYVQDVDLWAKELPMTEEVGTVVRATDYSLPAWDDLAAAMKNVASVAQGGKMILANNNKVMETHAETAREVTIDGHVVLAVSVPYMFGSRMAEMLCTEENSKYPFGAYYIHHPWGTQWGLRSRGEFDVSEIAKKFGGGGHKNAAGFEIKRRLGFRETGLVFLCRAPIFGHGKISMAKGARGKATKLHSLYVRQRAGFVCQNCGNTRDDSQIQCAHIISRNYGATRTDENNAFALCAKCHWHFGKWPMEFAKFVYSQIGEDEYERLAEKARNGKGKKLDWTKELERLQKLVEGQRTNA